MKTVTCMTITPDGNPTREPATRAERLLLKRYTEVQKSENAVPCPALDMYQTVVRDRATLYKLEAVGKMEKKCFELENITRENGLCITRKLNGEALSTIIQVCTEHKTGEPRDLVTLLKSRPRRYTHLVVHPDTFHAWIDKLACDAGDSKPRRDHSPEQATAELASLGISGVKPVLDPDMIENIICCIDARNLAFVTGDMEEASYSYDKEELAITMYCDFETMHVPHGIKFEPSADWSHMGHESTQPIEAYHPSPFVPRPNPAQADRHGADTDDGRKFEDRACDMLDMRRYADCLALLEAQDEETRGAAEFIRKFILRLIKYIHMEDKSDQEFDKAIEPYKKRIIDMIGSIAAAKSLDVPINTSYSTYHMLWDYASRVSLGYQVMLHDPDFMPWIAKNYPNAHQFLMPEKKYVNSKNTFIQMLSVWFNRRQTSNTQQDMQAIDNLCRRTAETCPNHVDDYAYKLYDNFAAAKIEMMVLAALSKNFEIKAIDPIIPRSKKRADVSFMDENLEYYVEVYSHNSYHSDASEIKADICPETEWSHRFHKVQLSRLKQANVPTVYIMNLNGFQFMVREANNAKFQEYACSYMPENAEVVVIFQDVTVFSIRDGKVAPEKSRLGRVLESSLAEVCRECMHINTNM